MNSTVVAESVAAENVSKFDEAVCLMAQRSAKVVQAETLLRRVLEVTPDDVPAWHLLQRSLKLQWRFVEALAAADHGLSLAQALSPTRTDYVAAMHTARSLLLHDLGQPAAALVAANEALKLEPDNADFQLNLAQARLMGGDWTGGFDLYQARWAARSMMAQGEGGPLPWPMWCGQTPRAGDSLLVLSEGDPGDILQFSRELLALRVCFSSVTLLCQAATQRLLQQSLGPEIVCSVAPPVLAFERRSPSWQWHLPLMSLPAILAYTPQTLPQCVPYLFADSTRARAWGERFTQHETAQGRRRLRVGLVWGDQVLQSQPDEIERRRTVPLCLFAAMLARSDVLWVSLQQGQARLADLAGLDAELHPLPWVAECGDFADMAALAANLDLVISADTAMAHLAGGLGRPVWLLNRFEGEWRWLWRREDTPWYPTMRIFNQIRFGDWAEVLGRVDLALDSLVRRHPEQDVALARRALQAGSAQLAAGRIDQAETAYRQALCLQPDLGVAATKLAQLLREQGRRHEANVYARRG
jgi:tetratricopeptide (TPR) repeat protein